MSLPNTAVAFPDSLVDQILAKIEETKALHPVLEPVSPTDRRSLNSIAEGREPYVADAYSDGKGNPKTLPGTVDLLAWDKLEEQSVGLAKVEAMLQGWLDLVQGIQAVNSDARYENARRYYKYLQDNLDKLHGAEAISTRLGRLFAAQGNRAKKATPLA
jgi:hypothetical protein